MSNADTYSSADRSERGGRTVQFFLDRFLTISSTDVVSPPDYATLEDVPSELRPHEWTDVYYDPVNHLLIFEILLLFGKRFFCFLRRPFGVGRS